MRHIEDGKMSFLVRSPLKRWTLGLIVLAVAAFVLMLAPHRAAASVTLDYFKAEWNDAAQTVVISWKTATELNLFGFIVQRSTSSGGSYVAITEMIPAKGEQLAGGEYGVPPFDENNPPIVDGSGDLVSGVTYWYRLALINSNAPNDYISPVAVQAGVVWRQTYLPVIVRHW
jgi:hypothetical protein